MLVMNSSFFLCMVVAVATYKLLGIIFLMVYREFRFHQDHKTIPSPLFPTTSSSPKRKHQVFLSFLGNDVRKAFSSHIRKAFERKEMYVFNDNHDIKRSMTIGRELTYAIRRSRTAVVLLSRNYASSSWCLDELVEIIKCREESGQLVTPLFYDVEPSDVKKQTGDFGKAFQITCKGKTEEVIKRWRLALEKVAIIAGYSTDKWDDESVMIEKITTVISNKPNISMPSSWNEWVRWFTGLAWVEAHMEKLEPMLCLDLDEVRMVGISGPCGIGKTTIARSLFSKHSESFDLSVFIKDVKGYARQGWSDEHGLKMQLQQQFLSHIFNQRDIEVRDGKERLKDKRVLVVLDDVDRSVQLDALANEIKWFGSGSRIIIITHDKKPLKKHGIKIIYEVDFSLYFLPIMASSFSLRTVVAGAIRLGTFVYMRYRKIRFHQENKITPSTLSPSFSRNEAERIEEVTNDISTASNDFTSFVGMKAHMEKMELKLCLENTCEVKMIGISGSSGIGKTTIARSLFSKHSESFGLSLFMKDVKGCARKGWSDEHGLKMQLQQQLLSHIFKQKDIKVPHLGVVKDRLKDKKVLVVLDDVDDAIQLDAMAKETQWFGPGSRIIIITEDERLLKAHGIKDIYKVDFPLPDEAYQIFCMNAFGQNTPEDGFDALAREALHFAGIHPLGIKGTGSSFMGMSMQEWEDELKRFRTIYQVTDIPIHKRMGYRISRTKGKFLSRITSRVRKFHVAVIREI